MGRYFIRTLSWIGLLVLCCSALPAQDAGENTEIVIEVSDQTGAVIADAQVEIAPLPKNIGKDLTVDLDGKLRLELPPGIYELSLRSRGFSPLKKRVEVQRASPQSISFVLEPFSCSNGCPRGEEIVPLENISPDQRYAGREL
jgi:hypothetical protein